jgi:hypothetical protein
MARIGMLYHYLAQLKPSILPAPLKRTPAQPPCTSYEHKACINHRERLLTTPQAL